MTAEELVKRKEEVRKDTELLKEDIKVAEELIVYIEQNIDNVTPETVADFDQKCDEYMQRFKVIDL